MVRVTTSSRGVVVARMPARRGIALLPDIPDRQSRDGRPQRVIGSEDAVIPVPMLARRRGLSAAAWPDPVGGFVPRHHVADFGCAAVFVADHGEPLEREGGAGAVSQQMFQRLT